MHFWLFAARLSPASGLLSGTLPRKTGLNWFIPALANISVGSSWTMSSPSSVALAGFLVKTIGRSGTLAPCSLAWAT
jgi:hypothetical protein